MQKMNHKEHEQHSHELEHAAQSMDAVDMLPDQPPAEQEKTVKEAGAETVMAQTARKGTGRAKGAKWKTWFRNKWVPPVVYLAVAAIIFTVMWQLQDRNDYPLNKEDFGISVREGQNLTQNEEQSVPVTGQKEVMIEPVKKDAEMVVVRHFFDDKAGEKNAQAMVKYGDSYTAHNGIDYALKSGEPFEVIAALSGKVTRVAQDPLVGYLIEMTHDDQLVTVYQSLSEVYVEEGDVLQQGTVLGIAGRNEYEQDTGNHLHFEVRKDGKPVSPLAYLNPPSPAGSEKKATGSEEKTTDTEKKTTDSEEKAEEQD